jgi:type VI secretion system protein ImpA
MLSEAPKAVERSPQSAQPSVEAAVAMLCSPIADHEPCGLDLDAAGDPDYLTFFAQVEGILPTSFFSQDDGKPFDPSSIDLTAQLLAVDDLLARSHDVRLLAMRARILILNRDITGFATTIAAMANWFEEFWDDIHPRPRDHGAAGRSAAVSSLTLPTVIFPLQYTPLLEGRRVGSITYRGWMIATGEIRPREGETPSSASAMTEAVATAGPASLDSLRQIFSLLTESLNRIQAAFDAHGAPVEIEPLRTLAGKIRLFVDPLAGASAPSPSENAGNDQQPEWSEASQQAAGAVTSLSTARQALVAIADYYATSEPSSPTLPLVRQAHDLIGKSFVEIVNVLVPSHVDKAVFQIGTDQVFDLPLNRLAVPLPAPPVSVTPHTYALGTVVAADTRFEITARAEALSLLDAVQRYFRHSEPSSPVPMLCERARALAEKDFMSVLENILPKSALKAINSDK